MSVISFHNLQYTVQVKPPDKFCGKKQPKEILKGVDGICKPGLNAILGPTGSGKTTLLDVLAGRKNPEGVAGDVLVDGQKQPTNFKCMTGYVVQDDVVMGTLSVRENFMFSSNCRLPTTVSTEEKEERVSTVIRELGLTHCADTLIGTEFIRGVSGGERKRTNIGMELIIAPSVLFLDEPTTGLDASTANAVINILRRLGRKGKTIILSIHQPRYSIFRMFDRLMLLAQGQTVYHGVGDQALDYFSSIGYTCEAHNNPPDFFLDVINGDSTAVKALENGKSHQTDIDAMEQGHSTTNSKEDSSWASKNGGDIELQEVEETEQEIVEREQELSKQLHEAFQKSDWNEQLQSELQPIIREYNIDTVQTEVDQGEYATGFLNQFKHVAVRTAKNSIRNPQTTILQVFVMVLFSVVTGVIYLQVDEYLPEGLQNRIGAFFFIIMNMIFANMASVELFIRERGIFVHESGSGFYRVSAYFLSKIFCDIIPLRCIPSILFSAVSYFMIGFQIEVDKFFLYVLCLILTTLCASSVGFFVSAAVGVFAIANLLMALSFVIMMIFGGLLVNIESIWVGIRWIQYFSLFRYALNILSINELKGLEFFIVINDTDISRGYAGEDYMTDTGVSFDTTWDLYSNFLALFSLTVGFLILAYINLRRVPKWK